MKQDNLILLNSRPLAKGAGAKNHIPSKDDPLFFLHIPKTAGTSLRKLVDHYYPYPQGVHLYERINDADPAFYEELKKARSFYGHFAYGLHNRIGIKGSYITFLREPSERVISYYNHQARIPGTAHHAKITDGLSLVELLNNYQEPQMSNHMVRLISGMGVEKLKDEDYFEPLNRAIKNIEKDFLFVGLVEELSDSMKVLSEFLGWSKRHHNLPITNVNPSPKSRLVDDETLKLIRSYNRLDYLLYEYVRWQLKALINPDVPSLRLHIINPKHHPKKAKRYL
ncbi:MAG: sulfotransferase family 2 domain-containing protein [Deinococcales bacterium]